jgi:hypothetical protein
MPNLTRKSEGTRRLAFLSFTWDDNIKVNDIQNVRVYLSIAVQSFCWPFANFFSF